MVETLFVDAKWEKEIVLGKPVLDHIKKFKSVALFASVQYLKLDKAIHQLKDLGVEVLTTKAKRTDKEIQMLGCDAYHDSFNGSILKDADAILYIGDGMFHPKALLLAQIHEKAIKDVMIWDPIAEKMKSITKNDIHVQLRKMKANLKRYIMAKTVGILVTVKPGQQYLENALKLKDMIEKKEKKAYIFIDDTLRLDLLENYPFIEAWVNTACPRIGTDDHVHIKQALVNIRDAYDPEHALEFLDSVTS